MESIQRPADRSDFRIAIICALAREADAVHLLFDHVWDDDEDETSYGRAEGDWNYYTNGRIGQHDVVLAHLRGMGTQNAASSAASLRASYTELKVAFLVGICGGVPKIDGIDVYLGDVVISNSIIQYDYGRLYPGSFEVKQTNEDSLGPLNKDLQGLLAFFQTDRERKRMQNKAAEHLKQIQNASEAQYDSEGRQKPDGKYQNPGRRKDRLFRPDYIHKHRADCHRCRRGICHEAAKASCSELGCKDSRLVVRNRSNNKGEDYKPVIFIGRVGSGNTVMKSGEDRDRIAAEHNIAMFEMEGAGVWGEVPCVVVKGVCDYADSHKNKRWQDFAAATAASVLKAMLGRYVVSYRPRPSPSPSTGGGITPCHSIPYIRNQDIVKRRGLIDKLHQLLPRTSPYSVAALWGLGGSGKTQMALEYAYERWDNRDSSILWVHADTEASFIHDYKAIARKLGVNMALDGEQLLDAVRDKIETLPQWVLVIDNADDIGIFHFGQNAGKSMNLLQYVPRSAGKSGTLLWTTRDEGAVERLIGHGRGIEVTRMTDVEARELLGIEQSQCRNSEEDGEVARLLEELEWFALAVKQAGAFMRRTSTPVGEYLAMLAEDKQRWNLFQSSATSESQQRPGVPSSVIGTWRISIERIRKENGLAYHILHVLAFVDNHGISHGMIVQAARFHGRRVDRDDMDIDDHFDRLSVIDDRVPLPHDVELLTALKRLKEYSFVSMHRGGDKRSYEMHKLVQDAARHGLHSDSLIKGGDCSEPYFAGIALQVVSSFYPHIKDAMWQQCEKYTAHAVRVTEWAELCGMPNRASGLLERVAFFLEGRGDRMEVKWLQLLERSLSLQKQALGDKHKDTLCTMYRIAYAHYRLVQNNQLALKMAHKVHRKQQKVLGETHPDTIRTLVLKAHLLSLGGDFGKAERLLVQAVDKLKDEGRGRSIDAAWLMDQRARTCLDKGDSNKAADLAHAALQIFKESLNPKNEEIITCTQLLADSYFDAANFNDAAPMYESALALARDVLGTKHERTSQMTYRLARSLLELGRYQEAEPLAREVADMQKDLFGPEHPRTLDSMHLLARILLSLNNFAEARLLVNQYYPLSLENLGPHHRITKDWAHICRRADVD